MKLIEYIKKCAEKSKAWPNWKQEISDNEKKRLSVKYRKDFEEYISEYKKMFGEQIDDDLYKN